MMIDTLGINRRFYGNRIGNGLEFFRNRLKNPIPDALTLIQSELASDPTKRTGLFHTLDLNDLYTTSAGEVNVVADGDPVGLITNQIGTITTTSPVSAERPIYKVTAGGVPYLQFLSTSRVTFNFGTPFVGAMVVSTLAGSYIVEIAATATFVWGQYLPVRDVTGISFIEGFDIQTSKGAQFRELLNADTQGQLDWDESRNSFLDAFYNNQVKSIPTGLFDTTPNVTNIRTLFTFNKLTILPSNLLAEMPNITNASSAFQNNLLESVPSGFFDNNPLISNFSFTFYANKITDVPAGLFDAQTVCTNYGFIFRLNTLTPQSVENVLVSINLSATNNNLLNGSIGIRGDGNPLTANAEIARQSLIAKGWTLTLDDIQPYEYALFKMEI